MIDVAGVRRPTMRGGKGEGALIELEDIAAVLVAWGLDPVLVLAAADDGDENACYVIRLAESEAVGIADMDA